MQVRAIPDEGGGFRVGVADHGPGIKPEEVSLLFNDFQRLDRTRNALDKVPASGLLW